MARPLSFLSPYIGTQRARNPILGCQDPEDPQPEEDEIIDFGFDSSLFVPHGNGLHFAAQIASTGTAMTSPPQADYGYDPSLLNNAKAKVPFFAKPKGVAAASVHGDNRVAAPSTRAQTRQPQRTLLPQGGEGLGQGVRTRNVPWRLETA
jgi:hypothetical protein